MYNYIKLFKKCLHGGYTNNTANSIWNTLMKYHRGQCWKMYSKIERPGTRIDVFCIIKSVMKYTLTRPVYFCSST